MSPTIRVSTCRVIKMFARTIDSVDPDDIFQHTHTLSWRFPVQQHAVRFYSSERDERCDGDFEAKYLDEFLYGLGEDLVRAKGDPMPCQQASNIDFFSRNSYQKSAKTMQEVRSHADDEYRTVSML